MAKYNVARTVTTPATPMGTQGGTAVEVENVAGGRSFQESMKTELVGILLTSFIQDEYYRTGEDTAKRLFDLVEGYPSEEIEFIAKAIVYARTKFGMRSVSHAATVALVRKTATALMTKRTELLGPPPHVPTSKDLHNPQWIRRFVQRSIHRTDDATELMAIWLTLYGKPIPHALLRGVRDALQERDEYQLAKYRAEGKAIKLIDLVRLTHPAPSQQNKEAFRKLVEGTLASSGESATWEAKLTQAGQKATSEEEKADLKADAWTGMIRGRKLGYFALLRNLRNIAQQAPQVLDEALEMLQDSNLIRKSLVMPLRFATAYREFQQPTSGSFISTHNVPHSKILQALSRALDLSLVNVPRFSGRTMVWLDNSGSMQGTDPKAPIYTGSLFAAILAKTNTCDVGTFSDAATTVGINPDDSTMGIADQLMRSSTPAGTNFQAAVNAMSQPYDRVIFLSDMQGWMADGSGPVGYEYSSYGYQTYGYTPGGNRYANLGGGAPSTNWANYKSRYGVDPWVYSFNLRDYGTMMFPENDSKVFAIAGLHSEILKVMTLLEQDREALVREIEAIAL